MTIPTAAARPGLLTTGGGQVGFADLCRVAVRQHRIGIACTLVGYLGFALVVLFSRQITFTMTFHVSPANIVPGFAAVVAVFWGAPLLATEYERHTNLFAWSQDTSPGRWLLAKVTVLGILIVVLTSLLTLAQMAVIGTGDWGAYDFPAFEASVPLALGYAAFGFALGLAAGAVCRRVVLAMGVTLIGFAAVRVLVAVFARPVLFAYLITPMRYVAPISSSGFPDGLQVNSSYLNAAGQSLPADFDFPSGEMTQDTYVKVMQQHGITQFAYDYQPISRVSLFQLAELAIFLILTAIAVWVAFRAIRKA